MVFTKEQTQTLIASDVERYFDREMEDRYREFLDEAYGTVKVAGYEYETSHALSTVDPVAYRCGFADWVSTELEETFYEIEGGYYLQADVDAFLEAGALA